MAQIGPGIRAEGAGAQLGAGKPGRDKDRGPVRGLGRGRRPAYGPGNALGVDRLEAHEVVIELAYDALGPRMEDETVAAGAGLIDITVASMDQAQLVDGGGGDVPAAQDLLGDLARARVIRVRPFVGALSPGGVAQVFGGVMERSQGIAPPVPTLSESAEICPATRRG